jgi:pimeloyl-ACP methyl ester carboxylesterase
MARMLAILLTVFAVGYAGLCAKMYYTQRSTIYDPQPRSLANAKTIALPTPEGDVLATVGPQDGPKALIYFGDTDEDTSLALPDMSNTFPNGAIYLMNYRGFGGSAGKPTEAGLVADGLALFDKVHAKHKDVIIVGRSLGAAVALEIASQRPVSRLVLVTPFYSLAEFTAPEFQFFPRALLLDKYESWRYAPKISVPTTIIAAENDELIPMASTQALYASFNKGIATLKTVPNVNHGSILNSPEYLKVLREAEGT